MRTAEEMYNYCLENNFGENTFGWGEKHFKVVENNLASDETPLICFTGFYYDKFNNSKGNVACALTNERIIIAQKKLLGGDFVQFIRFENLNDITKINNLVGSSEIVFDTYKEIFKIWFSKNQANNVFPVLNDTIKKLKNKSSEPAQGNQKDTTTELIKYKQLLDDGIITQEEFNAKKKQLLEL